MAHPQNSPRGLWAKNRLDIGDNEITHDATGIVLSAGIKISNKQSVTANSTGFIFSTVAAKPAARSSAKWAFFRNSTGVNNLAINVTGTTWKYVSVTSILITS